MREQKRNGARRSKPVKRQQPSPGRQLGRFKRILRRRLPELREKYHVKSLGVFGSYVRGEQRKRSDLDVLVEFERTPTLIEFIDLQYQLSNLLALKVDLVSTGSLKGEIGRRILSETVAI